MYFRYVSDASYLKKSIAKISSLAVVNPHIITVVVNKLSVLIETTVTA